MALTAVQRIGMYGLAVNVIHEKHPERGRAYAAALANKMLGAEGRRRLAEARRQAPGVTEAGAVAYVTHSVGLPAAKAKPKAAKKARKKARKAAETARITRLVTEALTASGTPQPTPGSAPVPSPQPGSAFQAAGMDSPFFRDSPREVTSADIPTAAKPLHEMTVDELQAFTGESLTAYGRAAGHGGPIWAEGPR